MRSFRRFCRLSGSVAVATALAACTLATPDTSEQVDQRSDGLSRIQLPGDPDPVLTADPTTPPPPWVGTCSQAHATYIVRRSAGACSSIATTDGTWAGCNLAAGVANGFCVYTWSAPSGTPSNTAYLALEAVAARAFGRPRIVADCSAQRATCSTPPPAGNLLYACRSSQECCEMNPRCHWSCPANTTCAPQEMMCKCFQDTQPSCDVCGFIINGNLTAVINPASVNATSYTVISGTTSWSVRAPSDAQSFTVPLSGATSSTAVTIRPVQ